MSARTCTIVQFQTLCERRDCAAYSLVGIVKDLLSNWEADKAFPRLEDAIARFEVADSDITAFYNLMQEEAAARKENQYAIQF